MTEPKLNFPDLTKITAPPGLLDDDTYDRMCAWPHGLEYWDGGRWIVTTPKMPGRGTWFVYRARPAPLVPDSVDWSHVGPAVNWIARDKSGVTGFECKPLYNDVHGEWFYSSGRVVINANHMFPSYRPGTTPPCDSLISRPGAEK